MQTRTHHLLPQVAKLYPFEESTVRLIRSSTFSPNDIYHFLRNGRAYILRIATHDEDHLHLTAAEMDWLSHLHREGVPVSLPLPMRDGQLVVSIPHGAKHHTVCAFEKAEGSPCDKTDPASWNMTVCRDWGYTLGRIHRATKSYQPANSRFFRPVFDGGDALHESLRGVSAIHALASALVRFLVALPRNRDTYGLIHNDFHHTNFFVNNGRVHVFDFDDSLYGYFAHDIGVSVYFALRWGLPDDWEGRQSNAERIVVTFMEGYRAANRLDDDALKSIIPFMQYRQLSDFAWVFDPDANPLTEEQYNLMHGVVVPGVCLSDAIFM